MSEVRCPDCKPHPILAEIIEGQVVIMCKCCKRKQVITVKPQEGRTGETNDL